MSPRVKPILHTLSNPRGRLHLALAGKVTGMGKWNSHADYWEAALVVSGTGIHRTLTDKRRVRKGDVILMAPDLPHRWQGEDALEIQFIQTHRTFFDGWQGIFDPGIGEFPPLRSYLEGQADRHHLLHLDGDGVLAFRESFATLGRNATPLENRIAFLRLIPPFTLAWKHQASRTASRSTAAGEEVVRNLRQFIQVHHAQDLTVEDLAHRTPYSPDHLARLFRRQTGYRLTEYIHEVRLKEFGRLTASGEAISRAAEAVGYRNVPYFNRVFKQVLGTTPSLWLKRKAPASGETGLEKGHRLWSTEGRAGASYN